MTYEVLNGAYHITETIGSGGFAKVKMGYHLSTGDRVAIKIMDKKALGRFVDRIKMEIETMKQLNHQNICKLYQVLETDDHFYLILEYCQGGELFDYIVSKDRLSEIDARACFRQIVAAVAYLHHLGYAHRDLKPENLLLDEDQNIKLIDFGLCTMPHGLLSKTFCGSPAYAAPELIARREYSGLKADMWSLGVLLYTLLCGFLPFNHENISVLYKKIMLGKYDTPKWLSRESVELLGMLLHTDPHRRVSIRAVARHPWLNKHFLSSVEWRSKFESDAEHLEDNCITEMSVHYALNRQTVRDMVARWGYDLTTATYLLLCKRKQQGRPVKLISLANVQYSPLSSLYLDDEFYDEDCGDGNLHGGHRERGGEVDFARGCDRNASFLGVGRNMVKCREVRGDRKPLVNSVNNPAINKIDLNEINNINEKKERIDAFKGDNSPHSRNIYQNISKDYNYEAVSNIKTLKDASKDTSEEQENVKPFEGQFLRPQTPKLKRRPITISSTPDHSTPATYIHKQTPRPYPVSARYINDGLYKAASNALSPSRSYDSHLNNLSAKKGTPVNRSTEAPDTDSGWSMERTPLKGRVAEVFGSLERGMDRLVDMLTPKKKNTLTQPRVVKATNNVSNVRQMSAHNYIPLLSALLTTISITYKRKGFTFKCKSEDNNLTFTLEIVKVGGSGLLGVSRKRVKGSSWQYKNISEQILSAL